MVFTFFKIPIIRLIKPILPKNIKKITTYFPGSLSSGVIPKDKPTVLKAENTSKAISKSVNCGLKISNNKIPKPIEANEIEIIANALKTDSLATLLVPISIFDLSLAIEKIFNVPVIEAYGMTEATHQITTNTTTPKGPMPKSYNASACLTLLADRLTTKPLSFIRLTTRALCLLVNTG